jgi:hypothetical protein
MEMGDIIHVPIARKVGFGPRHYGVYDGHDGVYHFSGERVNDIYVKYSTLAEFAQGATVGVDDYKKKYTREEVIARAQSKVNSDFGGYNPKSNNCEHFATWCVTGRKISSQTGSESEIQANIREMLDDKRSKYYDEPGHIYCHHETLPERLENYTIESMAKVVAAPIVGLKNLFKL